MAEQIQQLRDRLDERVLERAEADPQWKQRFVEDPITALGDMPEAQSLWAIEERARPIKGPPDATMDPPTEEYRQLTQNLTEKVRDKAASDPFWRQQLLNDAVAAIRETNFPEYQRLEEIRQKEEVRGHYDDLMSLADSSVYGSKYYCCPCRRRFLGL
jgi:hypothetical protein